MNVKVNKSFLVCAFLVGAFFIATIADTEAQQRRQRSGGGYSSSGDMFDSKQLGRNPDYVSLRGAYPHTDITSIAGAGIVTFGTRIGGGLFRTELELGYGRVEVEVNERRTQGIGLNPLAPVSATSNPAAITPTIPVNFEADNKTFFAFTNIFVDLPMRELGPVVPYLGFSLGYINVDTTPDYGNRQDVTEVAGAIGPQYEALIANPSTPQQVSGAVGTLLHNTYTAVTTANSSLAIPGFTSSASAITTTGTTQAAQQAAGARQVAYGGIAEGIANGVPAQNIAGIRQNIPVGTLNSFGYGPSVGLALNLDENFWVDAGYRYVLATGDVEDWHEARFGITYFFDGGF